MANAIQMIDANTYKVTNHGSEMTLYSRDGAWWMFTENACTRAWHKRFGSLKRFETLAEVEAKYKSWRGISILLAA